jgi:quinol-cytochrome oxidoreductase complex cytochrome b subunit
MRSIKKNPITSIVNNFFVDSPLPSNITYMCNLGSLLGAIFVLQIASGIFLACIPVPNTSFAFYRKMVIIIILVLILMIIKSTRYCRYTTNPPYTSLKIPKNFPAAENPSFNQPPIMSGKKF